MKQRLDYIDKAKGILIILVVIGHIWQHGYVFNTIYSFHMPAFFAISGMLLCYTQSYKKNYIKFFASRIYSFVLPFIFIEILGCCTDMVRHGINQTIFGYMYNTLSLHFNDPNLWFLFTLFWVEIVFVAMKRIIKNDMAIMCISILMFAISTFVPEGNMVSVYALKVCRYNLFFTIGFCCNKWLEKKNNIVWTFAVASILLLVGIFGRLNLGYMDLLTIPMLITAISGTYAVINFGKIKLPGQSDRMLCEIGKNTIIIYGTHHFYYATIGVLIGWADFSKTPLLTGLIILAGTIVLEIPTIYIINRWLPFLAGKKYKRKEKTA